MCGELITFSLDSLAMETTPQKVKIISAGAIAAMLKRMAYEVFERNFGGERIVVAGIGPRGGYLADHLEAHLRAISPLDVERADLDKVGDGLAWKGGKPAVALAGATLLIVDDVLYSGATLVQALGLAASHAPDKIQTAFLIDRGHHRFPVRHDFVGMVIATSLKQYVSVEVDAAHQRVEAFIF
jgi:pyrimidine operon attenuation protein/uracil phosphoribosyltransferase